MNKTVTLPEIAEYFHVTRYKVYMWIRNGELKATDVSNSPRRSRYRIDQTEFEAFKLRRAASQADKP